MLSEIDKAYIAGLIDGEGCITINAHSVASGKSRSYSLRLIIAQADREYLEYISEKLGNVGTIHSHSRWTHTYTLQICGAQAEAALRLVYDYLIIKKPQADVAFAFRMTKSKIGGDYCHVGQHGGGRIPRPLQDLRQYYADELKRLKIPKDKGRPKAELEPELCAQINAQVTLPGLD